MPLEVPAPPLCPLRVRAGPSRQGRGAALMGTAGPGKLMCGSQQPLPLHQSLKLIQGQGCQASQAPFLVFSVAPKETFPSPGSPGKINAEDTPYSLAFFTRGEAGFCEKRKATQLMQRLHARPQHQQPLPTPVLEWALQPATLMSEERKEGGRLVPSDSSALSFQTIGTHSCLILLLISC